LTFCGPPPSSPEELVERFNEYLMRAVVSGQGCTHSGSWFDEFTTAAIEKVAAAHPDSDPDLIAAVRDVFARQCDGTNRRQSKAHWDALISDHYSPWPATAFAKSVRSAFKHVLNAVNDPWEHEEIDHARADLDAAAPHPEENPRRKLVVEHLRSMIDELGIIPDYNIGREVSDWPKEFFLKVAETSLTCAVRFVEEPADDDLTAAHGFLEAAAGATPGSSQARRDFGIVVEHLGCILAELDGAGD
jgi:hypothetical protein